MRDSQSALTPPRRIAVLIAGHLRELCSSASNFDGPWSLVQTVAKCRQHATCDAFLFTWSTLDQQTPTWHTDLQGGGTTDASACVARLRQALDLVAVEVQRQPVAGCAVNDRAPPDGRWTLPASVMASVGAAGALMPSYGAVRCQVEAIHRAAQLWRRHTASTGVVYDAAVRLRPDLCARLVSRAHPPLIESFAGRRNRVLAKTPVPRSCRVWILRRPYGRREARVVPPHVEQPEAQPDQPTVRLPPVSLAPRRRCVGTDG